MNHTYVYRKHLRQPLRYIMLLLISLIMEALIMLTGLIITSEYKIKGSILIITLFIFTIVMFLFIGLEILLIYHLLLKRFKSISLEVTQDAIIYTNSKGRTVIPYEDIEKLEFPSIKYTGGWLKIIYTGGNVRLTVVMENIGGLISELKEKLNERELSHVYNEKKMFSFFKTAVFADESWDRIYHNYKIQLVTNYLCIIITTLILKLFSVSSMNVFFLLGSIAVPLLGYLVSEIIIGIKVKKRTDKVNLSLLPRNLKLEQKIFNIFYMGFSVGYIFVILMIVLI